MCKIQIENSDSLIFTTEKYTKADGLYSEEIKDIAKVNNCIYLGTSKGLISFFPDKLRKNNPSPQILLIGFSINDIETEIQNKYILNHDENYLTLFIKAISYKSSKNIKYRYKLDGFDDKWIETANRYVRFPALPPGKYTFLITATTDGENWSKEPVLINFKIKKHYTQTVAFVLFIILTVILTLLIIFYYLYSNLKKDIENKRNLLFAEQKALRSQMNPHFIFNALNSIRRYILENEIDIADEYLTSFASLMRRVLDNSKQYTISLESEIETLRLYLELEKMRFDESFIFKINVEKNIEIQSIKIPPMLIQPYLENAVWHGLAPKKTKGKLSLSFSEINKKLLCVIEDNGIGRKKSAEISKRRHGHVSTGLKNIEERINLINSLNKSDINIKIIDLYDKNNEAIGTKIKILFPINF